MNRLTHWRWWLLAGFLLMFFYVWPGVSRYRYYADGPTRIDRITNDAAMKNWDTGEWDTKQ